MRHITEKGIALIKQFEGFRPKAYHCPAGLLTIGYGHVIRPGETFSDVITEEAASALLGTDVQSAESAVLRLITVSLTEGQFDALVSFAYNLGAGALQRSTLRQKVNRGEHRQVPAEFMRWTRGGGKELPGLVKRRDMEARLYASQFS